MDLSEFQVLLIMPLLWPHGNDDPWRGSQQKTHAFVTRRKASCNRKWRLGALIPFVAQPVSEVTDASFPNVSSVLPWRTSLSGEVEGWLEDAGQLLLAKLSHLCIALAVLSSMLKCLYQLLIVPVAQGDPCTKLGFNMPLHPSFKGPNEWSVILISDDLSFWYQATVKDQSVPWKWKLFMRKCVK